MTAGKVQPSVQVKIDGAKRMASEQSSVQRDDFTKLLQAKKDGTSQTGKTDTGKKPDKADGTAADAAGKTEDVSKDSQPEKVTSQDEGTEENSVSQEALQQAAMQQAAAQMLMQSDEPVEEVVETAPQMAEVSSTAAVSAEAVPETVPEAAVQTEAAAQVQPKEAEPVKIAEPKEGQQTPEAAAQKPVQETETQKVTRTEERSDSGRQTEAKAEPKAQVPAAESHDKKIGRDTDSRSDNQNQDTVYTTEVHTSQEVREMPSMNQRTQQIPLKTTPEQLPQDLGKTLVSRTLEAGRTLTVELEPANLGKLTIRLVYEGDRASLSIMASNPRTLDMLSQKASEIAAILEEKTGQETIIYTQPAQQGSEQYDEQQNQNRSKEQGEPEEQKNQGHGEDTHQAESFAQQLRLGLV